MSDNQQVANMRENMDITQSSDGTITLVPENMNQVIEFAKLMSQSDLALPKFLRGNTGACMAISMQAYRWGMEPFAVASKAYSVNDRIAYESQLIAAVINVRAKLQNRLIVDYEGEGPTRKCIITGRFEGEDIDRVVKSPPINTINPKNSPLWKTDPDQQLFYYTVRVWSRRYQPELLMGVYEVDEFAETPRGPENARDVTPPAPKREEFKEPEFILWDNTGVEAGEFNAADEYISALCTLMDDMLKNDDAKGFATVWDNNVSTVDTLDDESQLTARTFFNGMKPKEQPQADDAPHETADEKQAEQPESPTEDGNANQEAEIKADENPAEDTGHEFRVMRLQGETKECANIQEWGELMLEDLKALKTADAIDSFRHRHGTIFMNLDPDFHNVVMTIGKAIDKAKTELK